MGDFTTGHHGGSELDTLQSMTGRAIVPPAAKTHEQLEKTIAPLLHLGIAGWCSGLSGAIFNMREEWLRAR